MNRYLLDTNVVTSMLMSEEDMLSPFVRDVVSSPYENQLYISPFSIVELIHLHRTGKIDTNKKRVFNSSEYMIYDLENIFQVKIQAFKREHNITLSTLQIRPDHNDPIDHAIIAHAITEKLTLISSDKKFGFYTKQGLDFVFNERRS